MSLLVSRRSSQHWMSRTCKQLSSLYSCDSYITTPAYYYHHESIGLQNEVIEKQPLLLHVRHNSSVFNTTNTRGGGGRSLTTASTAVHPKRLNITHHSAMKTPYHGQKRSMFIQTQNTPNPTSLMFIPGKPVMEGGGSANFSNAREAMASPLAKKLFLIDGVEQVFFATDFVTVSKSDDVSWSVIKPEVFAAITEFYANNEPILYDADKDPSSSDMTINEDDDEVVAMIKELLETRIRPAVQEDGGDIVFCGFDEDCGVVTLKMMGACSGCPSSSITLKSGIENMLMHYIPEVKGVVEAEADDAEIEGEKAFQKLEQHLSS
mmetsp:Transcript_13308/g.26527  ORF Transcript_13308/g.26527 Transcript_13308/m.26527 type:complete len:321 (+) Transcript_13308:252-1214(+)